MFWNSKNKVENIFPNESMVTLKLNNENLHFDKLIMCTGAWSKELYSKIGDDFPLDTERGYHILFNNYQLINRPVGWSKSGFYLVQLDEGLRAAGTVEIAGLYKPENTKIFISHGRFDSIIDIEEGRKIKQTLDKKGFDLFYKEYDIGHEISTDVIEDLSNWLEKN